MEVDSVSKLETALCRQNSQTCIKKSFRKNTGFSYAAWGINVRWRSDEKQVNDSVEHSKCAMRLGFICPHYK